jgi:hypothetical protein
MPEHKRREVVRLEKPPKRRFPIYVTDPARRDREFVDRGTRITPQQIQNDRIFERIDRSSDFADLSQRCKTWANAAVDAERRGIDDGCKGHASESLRELLLRILCP